MFNHNQYHYLFINWCDCCHSDAGYEIRVGRSDIPTGNFVDDINQSLLTGHGVIVKGREHSSGSVGLGHASVFTYKNKEK